MRRIGFSLLMLGSFSGFGLAQYPGTTAVLPRASATQKRTMPTPAPVVIQGSGQGYVLELATPVSSAPPPVTGAPPLAPETNKPEERKKDKEAEKLPPPKPNPPPVVTPEKNTPEKNAPEKNSAAPAALAQPVVPGAVTQAPTLANAILPPAQAPCPYIPKHRLDPDPDAARAWFSTTLLVLAAKDAPLHVPLAIAKTTPPPGIPVLGNDEIRFGAFVGAQMMGGIWFGNEDTPVGFELGGFVVGKLNTEKAAISDAIGIPEIYRPIYDATTGQPATVDVSFPGSFSGRLDYYASSQFWGAEANVRAVLNDCAYLKVEALGGFRYLGLNEGLDIIQISQGLGGSYNTGAFGTLTGIPRIRIDDHFNTQNYFYGGQAGTKITIISDPCWVAVGGKFGMGVNDQLVRTWGTTSYTQGGDGVNFVGPGGRAFGGLLAGPSNSRDQRRSQFACMAEGSAELGLQCCSWMELSLGYTFLWWGSVLRPADQIDQRVNLNGFPLSTTYNPASLVPAQPINQMIERDFWAQGLTFMVRFLF